MQPLDHGVLSIPLAKRHDIDAELDAYKAQQAREAKAARKEAAAAKKALQARAKAAVVRTSADQWEQLAFANGMTPAEVRKEVRSMAHWQPNEALRILRAFGVR